jgi:hypothetical protein
MKGSAAEWLNALVEYERLFALARKVEDFQRLNEALKGRAPRSLCEYLVFQRLKAAVEERLPCSLFEYLAAKQLEDLERKVEHEYWAAHPHFHHETKAD